MRAFWSDPYLWVHLAGLAVVPIFLEICLVGLAMGDPLLPGWVEIVLVAIAGITPILWMQWQRPFSIYSLVAVAVTPSQLTDDQRRILKIFKSQESQILAAIAAGVLFFVLVKLYGLAPIATTVAPHWVGGRLTGLLVAAIAFLLVNLFVQVPVSVLRALAVSQTAFEETVPYPSQQVGRDFSLLGIGVKQILPPIVAEPPRPKPAPQPPITSAPTAEPIDLWDEPLAPPVAPEAALEKASAAIAEAIGEIDFDDDEIRDTAIADLANAPDAPDSIAEIAEPDGDAVVADPTGDETHSLEPPTAPESLEPPDLWDDSAAPPLTDEAEPVNESELNPEILEETQPVTASEQGSDLGTEILEETDPVTASEQESDLAAKISEDGVSAASDFVATAPEALADAADPDLQAGDSERNVVEQITDEDASPQLPPDQDENFHDGA